MFSRVEHDNFYNLGAWSSFRFLSCCFVLPYGFGGYKMYLLELNLEVQVNVRLYSDPLI